jgi:putative tryptophan/tyrosine transport system substrate-binding protein
MAYGINNIDMFLRAAGYIDQILKAQSQARYQFYQLIKFEPVINLKTAKTLGLEIPPKVRTLADEVIE